MMLNPRPKSLQTLVRKLHQKKYRQEFRKYLAEGDRLCRQLLDFEPEKLAFIVLSEGYHSVLDTRVPVYRLEKNLFESLTDTEQTQGIFAVVNMPEESEVSSLLEKSNLIIACDAIQDPGNLGTILRNAVWFGVDALFLGDGTVDVYNPKTVRSSMSALSQLPIIACSLETTLTQAEQHGFTVFLFQLDSTAQSLTEIVFPKKTVLVFGNEGNGIRSSLNASCRVSVKIPDYSSGKAESLNVSTATSVALYAVKNQRNT